MMIVRGTADSASSSSIRFKAGLPGECGRPDKSVQSLRSGASLDVRAGQEHTRLR